MFSLRFFYWLLIALCPAILVFCTVNLNIAPTLLYPMGKLALFVITLLYASKIKIRKVKTKEISRGLASGVLLSVLPLLFILFDGISYLDVSVLVAKLESLDLKDNFVVFALALSFGNSAFEELFFRHLCLEKLSLSNPIKSSLLNGLIFSLHHFVVLCHYFSLEVALFFAFGTGVAGFIWSYLRLKDYSLVELWISHSICDIVVILSAGLILLN
ncbi:MAG: CPBP family intramembrane metalloprotease [Candidatus Cloacimonetes bacterium]|nr:CPBP family intramembrane metalloprotease [Candidatus Cloacimonadota bacterium]